MDTENFLKMARSQAAVPNMGKKREKVESPIKPVYLNYPGNLGRYQILPVNSITNPDGYPWTVLRGTREVCIKRKYKDSTGAEKSFDQWIKILPKSAYVMKDTTGSLTSSLTSEEDRLLSESYLLFDELFKELDAKNNREITKSLIRKRTYTLVYGYCLGQWKPKEARTTVAENYPALFIATASGFPQAIDDSLNETTLQFGNNNSWIADIYSEDRVGRKGSVSFNIVDKGNTPGFDVRVTHVRNQDGRTHDIPEEYYKCMQDMSPIEMFLGNQARYEEGVAPTERRLFNAQLITEANQFMAERLAAAKMANAAGNVSTSQAQAYTNAQAFSQPQQQPQPVNRDPMLAGGQPQQTGFDQNFAERNNAPFQTPPVSHVDPVSGFGNGGFGSGFGSAPAQQGEDELPF